MTVWRYWGGLRGRVGGVEGLCERDARAGGALRVSLGQKQQGGEVGHSGSYGVRNELPGRPRE